MGMRASWSRDLGRLYKLWFPLPKDATYKMVKRFLRRFFKVFTIYGHGGHLGHVTRSIYTYFDLPFLPKDDPDEVWL